VKRNSVTYRLGVSGDQSVKQALEEIGRTGDSSSKRLAAGYERAARAFEMADEKARRLGERVKAASQVSVQQRVDRVTGVTPSAGSRSEAEMRRDVAVALDTEYRAKNRLLAQYDPLFAAQQRLNAAMAEANRLRRIGALTAEEQSNVIARAQAVYAEESQVHENSTKAVGAHRIGVQQLGFQVSDFAVQMAGGTSAVRAFALQGPQAVQALALMGSGAGDAQGKFARFTNFLAGPWGAAVTVGISVVGLLATKLLDSGDAAEKAETKQYDFSRALDVGTLSAKEQTEALKQLVEETRNAIEVQGDFSRIRAANARNVLSEIEKQIADKEAELSRALQIGGEGSYASFAVTEIMQKREVDRLRSELQTLRQNERRARAAVSSVSIDEAQNRALDRLDPARKIESDYQREVADLLLSQERLREDPLSGGMLLSQEQFEAEFARITKLKDAALEAIREQERESNKAQGNKPVTTAEVERILTSAFPGIRITSRGRDPNSKLGRANPTSYHNVNQALDFARTPGLTIQMVRDVLRQNGIDIAEALDEYANPSKNATGGHFHVAFRRRRISAEDGIEQMRRQEEDLAKQREENAKAVRSLIDAGNPFTALLNKLDDDLAEIDRLAKTGPSQGGIGSEQADILRQQARDRYTASRRELFDQTFQDVGQEGEKQSAATRSRLDFTERLRVDQEAANRMLDAEFALVRASASERERALSTLQLMIDLEERGVLAGTEEYETLIRGNEALIERQEHLRELNDRWENQRRIGEDLVDTIFDPSRWDDWGDIGLSVIRQLIQEMLTLAAINPIKNALFGTDYATVKPNGFLSFLGGILGSAAGGVSGGGGHTSGTGANVMARPGAASGLAYSPGGYYDVGEFGKERVFLPQGSKVYGASATRQMDRQGGATPVIQFDLRNAVVTEDLLRQMQQMADLAAAQGATQGAEGGFKTVMEAHRRSHGRLFAVVG